MVFEVWVKNYNLMVFGESAGAGSISAHLVAPRSAGLFASALLESGPEASWIAKTMQAAATDFGQLVNASSCAGESGDSLVCYVLLLCPHVLFVNVFCVWSALPPTPEQP